jgi:hypothetical protein
MNSFPILKEKTYVTTEWRPVTYASSAQSQDRASRPPERPEENRGSEEYARFHQISRRASLTPASGESALQTLFQQRHQHVCHQGRVLGEMIRQVVTAEE